jgi:hypothetical protein
MFYLLKHFLFQCLVKLKPESNKFISSVIMVLYASYVYFMHSCLTENPSIDLEAMNPLFFRWFCHTILLNINQLDVELLPPQSALNQDNLLCSIVHETTSNLESCDVVDPVICQCRKHRELAHWEGQFVARFPLNVLMVHSSTLTVTIDGEDLTYGGFSLGKTIRFGSLEFIVDFFDSQGLSPKGSNLSAIFMGVTHRGSPSLHTILKDSNKVWYHGYHVKWTWRKGIEGSP